MTSAERIPVYAVWHPETGPLLALGMLTAMARAYEGGALQSTFEIRRPETAASFLDDLATRSGPAILLSSDYIWSLEPNLEVAVEAVRINPELVVVHGGPSAPKYGGDATRFLTEHADVAHVLVRGEGELTLCELLAVLAPSLPELDRDRLAEVRGITFLGAGGAVLTPDRPRATSLDELPSPYLTGEFDHVPGDAWHHGLSVETNRGCPYGCTFCDWGSATLSRIRKFGLDRAEAEFAWAYDRGAPVIQITDANFGIMSRDVDFAERMAARVSAAPRPLSVVFTPAKNTTKHLCRILDILAGAGITLITGLSLQTADPTTLAAVERSNISTSHYITLAAEMRRRGHPLQGDLMLGLPGQTYESFRDDLQFMFDHEIMARSWPALVLPNSPMNAPEYRERFAIEVDDRNVVTSSISFDHDQRRDMSRLRTIEVIVERLGVLRHVLRFLQWDHEVPAMIAIERLMRVTHDHPRRYPLLSWMVRYFSRYPVPPQGWHTLLEEAATFVVDEFGIARDSPFETVLALQELLLPAPGRTFPASIELRHDYLAYYRSATHDLFTTGAAGTPDRPLAAYGPATFTVAGDPLAVCTTGLRSSGDPDDEMLQNDFHIGATLAYELESPLLRVLPALSGRTFCPQGPELIERHLASVPFDRHAPVADHRGDASTDDDEDPTPVPVSLRAGRAS